MEVTFIQWVRIVTDVAGEVMFYWPELIENSSYFRTHCENYSLFYLF